MTTETRTPTRLERLVEKLRFTSGKVVPKVGPVVRVRVAHRGRVTGFSVACVRQDGYMTAHGVMPVLAPSRDAAILAAAEHLLAEHDGRGALDFGENPGRRPRRRRR